MTNQYTKDRWTLPLVIDPDDHYCFQILVPKDRFHLAAFYGAIQALTYSQAWEKDPAHTAAAVSRVWQKIWLKLLEGPNCPDCAPGNLGGFEDEILIRQNPDNPCEIQSSADGIHWCTFIDLSLCRPGSGQPGGGSTQPEPGGGIQCYDFNVAASSAIVLPTVVSTGDIITIAKADGAGNASGEFDWRCTDGQLYFAGTCQEAKTHDGGDPDPSLYHGQIIMLIDGTYYSAIAGTAFTVPGGISDAQVTLQANFPLPGASGSYQLNVCVQNNQLPTWLHVLDFRTGTNGFVPWTAPLVSGSDGSFSGGTGFVHGDGEVAAVNNWYRSVLIQRLFSARITHVEMRFTRSGMATNQPHTDLFTLICNGDGSVNLETQDFDASSNGTDIALVWDGDYVTNGLILQCVASFYGPASTFAGSATILQVTIGGLGPDPFV
jgi:hypothetical protein